MERDGLSHRDGPKSPRVLVIGLDAAEIELINRWAQEGCLPHLQALLQGGIWGRLDSTAKMLSGSVWSSLFSGTLPGKHGRYYPIQPRPGHQGVADFSIQSPSPLWKFLQADGRRCFIMDVPFTSALSDFAGVQIFDWGTYDKVSRPRSLPAWRLRDLVGRRGRHPLEKEIKAPTRAREYRRLLQNLLDGASLKGEAVSDLLASEPWDFFFVVFSETHPAGHYFWHLCDDNNRSLLSEVGGPDGALQQTYIAVDRAIGRILKRVDKETAVLVLSGLWTARSSSTTASRLGRRKT